MDDLELAYVHDGSLEGLLTAVFLAFERKEYPSDVSASCRFMPRLGQRIVEVETNMERAWRVRAGIIRVCGMETYQCVVAASLSDEPDAGSSILSFVRYAMKRGPRARFDKAAPDVERFAEIVRSVRNERHYWVQFMRFSKTRDGVYVAVCNPKASVVPLLMGWFSARFNTQPFIVFDEVHHVAGVSHNGEWQLVRSPDFVVPSAAVDDAFYEQAWKTFYDSVAIDARYNPELRRSFMPKRLWKNIVELSDVSLGGPGIKEERHPLPKQRNGALKGSAAGGLLGQ